MTTTKKVGQLWLSANELNSFQDYCMAFGIKMINVRQDAKSKNWIINFSYGTESELWHVAQLCYQDKLIDTQYQVKNN